VSDDKLGDLTDDFKAENGGSDVLAAGVTITFTVTTSITVDTTNIVTVTGTDDLGHPETATDTATVDVLNPGIEVIKTASPTVIHNGDLVTYTYAVENTGDCQLTVTVSDNKLGDLTTEFVTANSDSDVLAAGVTVTFTVTTNIYVDTINIATVTGTDDRDYTETDSDCASVDVLNPLIDVIKYADKEEYHEGDFVEYTFIVKNTGDCPLYGVVLDDDDIEWTSLPIDLAVNEEHTFTVEYQITGDEPDPFINFVIATGEDEIGGVKGTVDADDTDTIDILHPAIDVTKTADKVYAYLGDTVTYSFRVENIGDCILEDVTLVDTIFGDLTSYLPDTTLDIDEVNEFDYEYVIPFDTDENIVNVVTARGKDNLNRYVQDEDGETVIVVALPPSAVTDSSLCYFDRNEELDGAQFRLIFTQDPKNPGTYKLTASNPGQFYYNIFFIGTPGEEATIDITIPYPFVTQGANPIHFYSDASYCSGSGCFLPSNELTDFEVTGGSETPSGARGIVLEDYGSEEFITLTAVGDIPSTSLIYVTIHLDYGFKGTIGYQKNGNDDAIDPDTEDVLIPNYSDYEFSFVGGYDGYEIDDSQTVQNENTFKRNPGFGGLVTDEFLNGIEGYTVRVFDPEGNLIGEAVTDEDGYWFIYYKHKGKRKTFTVKLYDLGDIYVDEQDVELKANKFAEVNFENV
jgi:uncharacterized repeat protein (TIGR01451 family)